MNVRSLSAQPRMFPVSFPVSKDGQQLKTQRNYAAVSSPKAKVTRSNRVGCAKTGAALAAPHNTVNPSDAPRRLIAAGRNAAAAILRDRLRLH